MDISHLFPGYQFGFRHGHSPIQQAHRVVNEIVTSLEERVLCTAVFLDVAKAFDKVWHIGLLYKLKASLPGPYYLLLQSYLTDRYFQVRYNGVCSDCYEVRSGVPQGSVLGPLLYLIFTVDLPTTEYTTFATFPVDTGLLAVHRDPVVAFQRLQSHLTLLHNWFTPWKIRVTPTKSAQVTFNKRLVTCPPVVLHITPIPVKHDVKYLGLHFDRQLTWRKHIQSRREHLDLKLRAMSCLLGRRFHLSLPNQLLLYKCMLKPLWEFSCGAVRSPLTRKSFNVFDPKFYAPLATPLGMSPTSNCIPTLVNHSSQRRSTDPSSSTTAGWLDIAMPWLLPCLRPPTLPGGSSADGHLIFIL